MKRQKPEPERARILTSAEFKHALNIAELSRDSLRNILVLCLTHALGLRISECSQVTVAAMLYPSGRVREELTLDPRWTKYNRTRTVPVSNRRLLIALDAYLDYRISKGVGVVAGETDYRGLSPSLPIIMSSRGTGFSMNRKRRTLVDGSVEVYRACDSLTNAVNEIYQKAGLVGASTHSGRRAYATRLLDSGVGVEEIAHLLGHGSIDHSYPYTEPSDESIRQAFEAAL